MVNFVIPDKSPLNIVSLLTSQMRNNSVDKTEAKPDAQLFTVVNIAYAAPSLPAGHKCTIIIVVGLNITTQLEEKKFGVVSKEIRTRTTRKSCCKKVK